MKQTVNKVNYRSLNNDFFLNRGGFVFGKLSLSGKRRSKSLWPHQNVKPLSRAWSHGWGQWEKHYCPYSVGSKSRKYAWRCAHVEQFSLDWTVKAVWGKCGTDAAGFSSGRGGRLSLHAFSLSAAPCYYFPLVLLPFLCRVMNNLCLRLVAWWQLYSWFAVCFSDQVNNE